MKPSPEMESRGLRAYEQARAFEAIRTWRLPLVYTLFLLAPMIAGGLLWSENHTAPAGLDAAAAVVVVLLLAWHWCELKARYAGNRRLLVELERLHGDELPWVRVERHLAALEKLQRELAANGRPPEDGKAG